MGNKHKELTLFFTSNASLQIWNQLGSIERETALYKALSKRGVQVRFVTYGDSGDLRLQSHISGIKLICNRWGIPQRYYVMLLTKMARFIFTGNTILKSNQVKGANVALRSAQNIGKPFIARCGYLWSQFALEKSNGHITDTVKKIREYEKMVFTQANVVVVTTKEMQDYIINNYSQQTEKIHVIPNYVLTEVFKPNGSKPNRQKRLCFIGRLETQKNLFNLLEAIKGLDLEIFFVGDGSLRKALKEKVNQYQINAEFVGNQPHNKLPEYLNSSNIFILPSSYEGHPKALLEAMACGLPVIGTNVSGIRKLITHKENGYLCGESPQEIRSAIQAVLGNEQLQTRMGVNARAYVAENFTLERIVEMELALLDSLWIN
ncbi:MAG: glycosyltransferase family 4 protein [Anaerolineales bacterium]|jgi:glycosyltransferase involved in cell wall biosynthesis